MQVNGVNPFLDAVLDMPSKDMKTVVRVFWSAISVVVDVFGVSLSPSFESLHQDLKILEGFFSVGRGISASVDILSIAYRFVLAEENRPTAFECVKVFFSGFARLAEGFTFTKNMGLSAFGHSQYFMLVRDIGLMLSSLIGGSVAIYRIYERSDRADEKKHEIISQIFLLAFHVGYLAISILFNSYIPLNLLDPKWEKAFMFGSELIGAFFGRVHSEMSGVNPHKLRAIGGER